MKTSWSKILFIVSDVALAVYIVVAFASFDRKGDNKAKCDKVNIEIADNATNGFLDTKVIRQRLLKAGIYPIGQPLNDVDTRRIEETLRKSPFVQTAECYKTEGGHVYISVTQRMPVIRIKADNGDDYYVDDNDCIMPKTNYTSDLIIATGNISRRYATNYISPLGKAIMSNDLWKNLIEQINVTPDRGIELVPRIGDHVVYIGQLPDTKNRQEHEKAIGQFMERKMTRLEKFYKYGLSQVGWNKYSYINIEFDNQIICKKAGYTIHQQEPVETDEVPAPATPGETDATPQTPDATPANAATATTPDGPKPEPKAKTEAKEKKKAEAKEKTEKRKPEKQKSNN